MSDIAPSANAGARSRTRIKSGYARYVFTLMFIISLLNYMDRFVLSGAANTIAHEFGFDTTGIGLLASAFLIVYTLGTIPLGIWADRAKRKNVVAVCVTAWSIFTALTALAWNFASLFVSRMLVGIGEAGYFPAGTALMSDYFSRAKRSRVMSLWSMGQYVGILVGFYIGGKLALMGQWRLAFVFAAVPGLLLALLIWRVREPRRNQADEEELARQGAGYTHVDEGVEVEETHARLSGNIRSQFAALLNIKTMRVLIVMQIFAFFVLGVNTTFLPTYLQQNDLYHLSADNAALFSGVIIVLAGLIGTVTGGFLADLLNRRNPGARVLVCGIGFLLSAPSFAACLLIHNFAIFTAMFVLTVILVSIYNGPSTAATQDVVPSVLRATALALVLLLAHLLGDAFSPTIVGVLASAFDPTHLHFHNNAAGQDLGLALLVTCTPALVIAGLVGVFGARWMKDDIVAAEEADRLAKR